MKIDAHQHFIAYREGDYPWITSDKGALRRDFTPGHLEALLDESGFDASIAVQARQTLDETGWLLSLARGNRRIAGVVGWVDLRSPQRDVQLSLFAADPKFVGVRHVIHDEPDDDFMLETEFRRGIASLARFDLTYDLLLFPRHLRAATALVDAFPRQRFVVDHLAKPEIRARKIDRWARDVVELAKRPQVYCKLSGMVTEAPWGCWKPEDFYPYLDVVFEAFGPERLMVGSDWPVCTLSGSYAATMDVVVTYLERLAPELSEAVLGGNCARFYGIGERTA